MLKRLAHLCFVSRKFSESEKFFKVCADMTNQVTSNPINKFQAQKNLLILYTHSDIEKAKNFGERLLIDSDEYGAVNKKEIDFMMGNIHFLDGDHAKAKQAYRKTLKLNLQPHMEANVLNNLAFASWMHVLDLPKLGENNPMKEQILKEESFTMTYML